MEQKIWSSYEARAKVIKALAHPARLFIVDKLQERETCVCELTDMIGFDTSTISKHLSILKNAGIVGDRKVGTSSYYYLRIPCVLSFFNCIEEVLESNLQQQKEIVLTCRKR